jgi:hypothetical protein
MRQVEEYRVLPQRYTKKTKGGIHNLAPKHLVKVSRTVEEGENWLNLKGEALGYPVYRGMSKY